VGTEQRFDAFISYSRRVDAEVAARLQSALQTFAKPWYRLRVLRVFRDDASLSAQPSLWSSIVAALDSARFFILLASPEAARSEWVEREVHHWVTHRDPARLLIGLTDGELAWDVAAGDFDWSRTNALPRAVGGVFAEDPRWIDLRWIAAGDELTLRNPRFRDAVADFASPLHARAKDELVGENVRQHRRAMRLARGAAALLVLLVVVAAALAVLARERQGRADAQARIARSRQLAAETTSALSAGRLDRALALAARSWAAAPTVEAKASLAQALAAAGPLERVYDLGPIVAASVSADGKRLAVLQGDRRAVIVDVRTGRAVGAPLRFERSPNELALDEHGTRLALGFQGPEDLFVWNVSRRRWEPPGGNPDTARSPSLDREFPVPLVQSIAFGGGVAAWTGGQPGKSLVGIWRDGEAKLRPSWFGKTCQVAVSRDGTLVAQLGAKPDGSGGFTSWIAVWRTTDAGFEGAPLALFQARKAPTRTECAPTLQFGAAGSDVLAVGGWEGTVTLWNAVAGQRVGSPLQAKGGITSHLAFSPDGSHLVATDDGGVTVWNLARRREVAFPRPASAVDAGAWLGPGNSILEVGLSGVVASGRLRGSVSAITHRVMGEIANTARVADARFVADGTLLLARFDGVVEARELSTGRRVGPRVATGLEQPSLLVSRDRRRVLAATPRAGVSWTVGPTAEPVRYTPPADRDAAFGVASDGTVVAVSNGGFREDARVWLAPGRRPGVSLAGTADADVASVHADDRLALVGTYEWTAVWDLRSGRRISRLFPRWAEWTEDGGTIVADDGGAIHVWHSLDGPEAASLPLARGAGIAEIGPDGRLIVGISAEERKLAPSEPPTYIRWLWLWDTEDGTQLGRWSLGDVPLGPYRFAPDGHSLVLVGPPNEVWELDPERWAGIACKLAGGSSARGGCD
jgi:hypothetical protein